MKFIFNLNYISLICLSLVFMPIPDLYAGTTNRMLPPEVTKQEMQDIMAETEKMLASMTPEERAAIEQAALQELSELAEKDPKAFEQLMGEVGELLEIPELTHQVVEPEPVIQPTITEPVKPQDTLKVAQKKELVELLTAIINTIDAIELKAQGLNRIAQDAAKQQAWADLQDGLAQLKSYLHIIVNRDGLIDHLGQDEFSTLVTTLKTVRKELSAAEPRFIVPDVFGLKDVDHQITKQAKEQSKQSVDRLITVLNKAIQIHNVVENLKKLIEKYDPKALKQKEAQEKLEASGAQAIKQTDRAMPTVASPAKPITMGSRTPYTGGTPLGGGRTNYGSDFGIGQPSRSFGTDLGSDQIPGTLRQPNLSGQPGTAGAHPAGAQDSTDKENKGNPKEAADKKGPESQSEPDKEPKEPKQAPLNKVIDGLQSIDENNKEVIKKINVKNLLELDTYMQTAAPMDKYLNVTLDDIAGQINKSTKLGKQVQASLKKLSPKEKELFQFQLEQMMERPELQTFFDKIEAIASMDPATIPATKKNHVEIINKVAKSYDSFIDATMSAKKKELLKQRKAAQQQLIETVQQQGQEPAIAANSTPIEVQ